MVVGIVVGILLSIIAPSLYMAWVPFQAFLSTITSDPLAALYGVFGANFAGYNAINQFMNIMSFDVTEFFAPVLLSWIFIGIIAGGIAQGIGRGIAASSIVMGVVLLLWLLFGVFAGVSIVEPFTTNLMDTLGAIVGAEIGAVIGGLVGGAISGPYEEFY